MSFSWALGRVSPAAAHRTGRRDGPGGSVPRHRPAPPASLRCRLPRRGHARPRPRWTTVARAVTWWPSPGAGRMNRTRRSVDATAVPGGTVVCIGRRRQSALDRPRERAVGQDGHATCRHQARRYLQPPSDRHDERGAAHADLGRIRTRQVADRRRSGFPVQEQPELPDPGQAQQVRREGFPAHRLVPDLLAQDHLRLLASRSSGRWLFARSAIVCGGSPSRDRDRPSGRRCRPW